MTNIQISINDMVSTRIFLGCRKKYVTKAESLTYKNG